jgi:XTP/dITP diphosphohydrolase
LGAEPGLGAPRGLDHLLLATTNHNKVLEIRPLLAHLPFTVLTLADLAPVDEPDEPAPTFWENARLKALSYARATGLVVVAEDSGLEIAALDGAPGVHSARFLGHGVPYPVRFAEINRRLGLERRAVRDARFVTALAMVRDDVVLFETEAGIEGTVASSPAGEHGFGYDPIFFYPPLAKTTAQMTLVEKRAVSHRARAFRDLARWLTQARGFTPVA